MSTNSRMLCNFFADAFPMSLKRFLSENFFCFVFYMGNVKIDSDTKLLITLKMPSKVG